MNIKIFTMQMPEELHKAVKMKAARDGVPMTKLIQRVLFAYCNDELPEDVKEAIDKNLKPKQTAAPAPRQEYDLSEEPKPTGRGYIPGVDDVNEKSEEPGGAEQ